MKKAYLFCLIFFKREFCCFQGLQQLKPEVVALIEDNVEASQLEYVPRFEAFAEYMWALFESHDALVEGGRKKLLHGFEKLYFGTHVASVLACEGGERRVRPHSLDYWLSMARAHGFELEALSDELFAAEKAMMRNYAKGFGVGESTNVAYLMWQDKPLAFACQLTSAG